MLYQFHKSDIHQGISDALLYRIFLIRSPRIFRLNFAKFLTLLYILLLQLVQNQFLSNRIKAGRLP